MSCGLDKEDVIDSIEEVCFETTGQQMFYALRDDSGCFHNRLWVSARRIANGLIALGNALTDEPLEIGDFKRPEEDLEEEEEQG